MIEPVFSWIGLLAVLYVTWRLALRLADYLADQRHVFRVMTGQEPPPWDPDAELRELRLQLHVQRGIWDDERNTYV